MQIQENISLKPFNTFGINATARYFARFSDVEQLAELSSHPSSTDILVLGGGSNMLLTKDFNGLVIKNEITGIQELHEDIDFVYVKVGAGVNWHAFVTYTIERNWAGAENLSLIPGNVGASPMQNIGAYGVELAEIFWSLEAFHWKEKKIVTFTLNDCGFGYRESVFKNKFRNQFVITHVTFRLRKKPIFHTSYGAITQELEKMGVKELSIQAISRAVINIRTSKLPDPNMIGNAGSFFKNPEISAEKFNELQQQFPGIVGYSLVNGNYKLAAGWLIEHSGPQPGTSWKGYRVGDAGVHPLQALVLVNYGNASGQNIYDLSENILLSVENKYRVKLEREVNII